MGASVRGESHLSCRSEFGGAVLHDQLEPMSASGSFDRDAYAFSVLLASGSIQIPGTC